MTLEDERLKHDQAPNLGDVCNFVFLVIQTTSWAKQVGLMFTLLGLSSTVSKQGAKSLVVFCARVLFGSRLF